MKKILIAMTVVSFALVGAFAQDKVDEQKPEAKVAERYVDDYKVATYEGSEAKSFEAWTEDSILRIMRKLDMLVSDTPKAAKIGAYFYAMGYTGVSGVEMDTPTEEVREATLNALCGTFWHDAKNGAYWTFQSDYAAEQAGTRENRTVCVLRDAKTKKVYKWFKASDITNLYYSVSRDNMPYRDSTNTYRVNSSEADIDNWLYRQYMYVTITFACQDTNRTYEFTVPVIERDEKKGVVAAAPVEEIYDHCEACKRPLPKDATSCPYCQHDAEGIDVYCPIEECRYEFRLNRDKGKNMEDVKCPNPKGVAHKDRTGKDVEVWLNYYQPGLRNEKPLTEVRAQKAGINDKLPKVLPVLVPILPEADDAAARKAAYEAQKAAAAAANGPKDVPDDPTKTIKLTVYNSKTKVKESYTLKNVTKSAYVDDFYNGDGLSK